MDPPLLHRTLHRLVSHGMRGSATLWRHAGPLPEQATWNTLEIYPATGPADRRLYHGEYEWAERLMATRMIRPGDLCVDVGANMGVYSALFASLGAEVIACEPSPVALARLRKLRLPRLTVHPVAIGATRTDAVLAVAGGDSALSTLRNDPPSNVEDELVEVVPLGELVGGREIHFLKVDVEGYERQVVDGLVGLLDRRQIKAGMFELDPGYGDTSWVKTLQRQPGYRLRQLELARRGWRWKPVLTGRIGRGTVFLLRD